MNKIEYINDIPIGGKCFDGEYIKTAHSRVFYSLNFSAGETKTFDISNIIATTYANDTILTRIELWCRTGSTSGNVMCVALSTEGGFRTIPASIRTRTASTMECRGGAFIPFLAGSRILTVQNLSQASFYNCYLEYYKRIGTNK